MVGVCAIVGAWLPWVRKTPVGTMNGEPYYTSEWVFGLQKGFHQLDVIILLPALAGVGIAVLSLYRDWPQEVLLIAALPILIMAGERYLFYTSSSRYIVAPGLYLCLGSGVLLLFLGLNSLRHRGFSTTIIFG